MKCYAAPEKQWMWIFKNTKRYNICTINVSNRTRACLAGRNITICFISHFVINLPITSYLLWVYVPVYIGTQAKVTSLLDKFIGNPI